ncbi:unnamed protein product [Protopolystoma xenopodis]|uniref:Uncharacterized protein n=1 Tax=Protopolystoma xenopodis TaxID=117903 RepID=A0A3S5CSS6_9PLAT|nr:unnamed protein product [Protopolystoma xenopodis]
MATQYHDQTNVFLEESNTDTLHRLVRHTRIGVYVTMAERLRRWTRNPMGFPRADLPISFIQLPNRIHHWPDCKHSVPSKAELLVSSATFGYPSFGFTFISTIGVFPSKRCTNGIYVDTSSTKWLLQISTETRPLKPSSALALPLPDAASLRLGTTSLIGSMWVQNFASKQSSISEQELI